MSVLPVVVDESMTASQFLELGYKLGFLSRDFCFTHDGPPLTEEENAEWDEDVDVCVFAVRVFSERPPDLDGGREGWFPA